MLRVLSVAVLLVACISAQALAQAPEGHVWSVNELRAHSGSEAAYTEALQRFDLPAMEEVISQGGAVSQRLLIKQAGNMADGTHLLIIEYASWEDYINVDSALNAASMNLFGRPYAQVAAEEFVPLRDVIRRDVYLAPPGPM